MPSYYDMPAVFGNVAQEEVSKFQKLPFYLVKNEVKVFPSWNVFDQLFGSIQWRSNEGDIMKGVTPQRSPVGRGFFFPNEITAVPNKDVYEVSESTEQATVKLHRYESFQFNFLPSFDTFWGSGHIRFANQDIASKIAISNNQFIETNLWFNAPNVYLAGSGLLTGCPTAMGNAAANAANSKTAAWLVAAVTEGGPEGTPGVLNNLRLRDIERATINLQEDMGAPAFEGAKNMPIDNEGLKGKYVLVTSTEAWFNFKYDPDVNQLKSINLDLLFQDFRGLLHGVTTVKFHRYPIRFNVIDTKDGDTVLYPAGTPIAPEMYDSTDKKWKPNPYYTSLKSAPYEIAWMLGADTCKTIKVGPPPKEFASNSMSTDKFYSLKWNGEVRITDQILIQYANNEYDLNQYGTQLKFISQCTHGYLVAERRNSIPIIFKRTRPAVVTI